MLPLNPAERARSRAGSSGSVDALTEVGRQLGAVYWRQHFQHGRCAACLDVHCLLHYGNTYRLLCCRSCHCCCQAGDALDFHNPSKAYGTVYGSRAGFFNESGRGRIPAMKTILAIETSSELASVALMRKGELLARESSGVQTHSQTLLPMVQEVLAQAGLAVAQCDAIAFGAGPGSFTGVRTACGVAQGLAFGADLPVVPVVTLLAMAEACRHTCGSDEVLVLLDARMEEVYWAQYRYLDGWQTVSAPALSPASAVVAVGTPVACGNGLSAYAAAFADLAVSGRRPQIMPQATHVAHLAQIELLAGRTVNARDAQPIYLRNKVALTTQERQARAAA